MHGKAFKLFEQMIKIYWLTWSQTVQKVFYIHTGFNDYSLLWVVNGKIYDILFIKLRK